MKRFQNTYISLATLGALALTACSDDFKAPDNNPEGITGITLNIPNTEGASSFAKTRSEDAVSRGADDVAREGAIIDDDLWLFAYGENNTLVKKLSLSDAKVTNTYKSVNVTLTPDIYRMYVVANVSKYIASTPLSENISEQDLKNLVLNFSASKTISLENGLPMACRNTEIKVGSNNAQTGTLTADGTVEISAGECPTIFADMTFLCSKVRYTVLHDRNSFSSAFGQSDFDITGTAISNISNVTKWNNASAADYSSSFDMTYAAAQEKVYPADLTALKKDGAELDVISGNKNLKGEQRAWQQTLYLPENLATSTSDKSKLTISTETNGVESAYELVLNEKSDNNKLLERGRFYDIIIEAASRDVYDLSNITVSDWTPETLVADFTHTYLTLSQTEGIEVKSLEPFSLGYLTDGTGGIKFECKTKMGENPIITYKTDSTKPNTLVLQVNNNINVANVPVDKRIGTADVELRAGNILKTIKVNYDMSPIFVVTPTERTIGFEKGASNLTEFEYVTNLGGFNIRLLDEDKGNNREVPCEFTQGSGDNVSKLKANLGEGSSVVEGKLIMTEVTTEGPKTSVVYNFIIEPKNFPADEPRENYQKVLKVTVQPKMDDYRIYFRAINDYFITNTRWDEHGENKGKQEEFLKEVGYLLPGEDQPWKDFWCEYGTGGNGDFTNNDLKVYNPGPSEDRHRIYIYNQKGNNSDWSNPGDNVIYFTQFIEDNNKMTADYNNLGWYYRDLSSTSTGKPLSSNGSINSDSYYQIPRRGETLLIFHNNLIQWPDDKGNGEIHGDYIAHRVATSNEPGVPLFSYSDNIGWYLYDPTRDPVFNCYDDKPVIEDVEYVIYSDKRMNGWERNFGKWRGNKDYFITLHAEHWNGDEDMNKEMKFNNKTYYMNKLHFKAPRGEHDKAIEIIFDGGQRSTIFDGGIFTNDTGTFANGQWSQGEPK